MRWILPSLLALALVGALAPPAAEAVDVSLNLYQKDIDFRFSDPTNTSNAEITVTAGDALRLRIENLDDLFHTFTMAHVFTGQTSAVDEPFPAGTVRFVNITTSEADVGRWQFWCIPHSSGEPEQRAGMIGYITVVTAQPPPPPRTPGFEALVAVAALAAVFAVLRLRRKA